LLVAAAVAYLAANRVPDRPVEVLKPRWATPPSQFFDVAGMSVHLRDEGPRDDPVPLLLLHGTGASLHTWDGWRRDPEPDRDRLRLERISRGIHQHQRVDAPGIQDRGRPGDVPTQAVSREQRMADAELVHHRNRHACVVLDRVIAIGSRAGQSEARHVETDHAA
jgi:hypothetical protein